MACNPNMRLKWLWLAPAILGGGVGLGGCREGVVADAVATPHHVRIVWTEQPQSRALIAWDTGAVRGEKHGVWIAVGGTAGEPLQQRVAAHASDEYDGRGRLHYHHVQLVDLPPNSVVRFVVDSDGRRSREFFFRTAPAEHRDFAILSGGDSRSHRESRQQMNRLLARIAETDEEVLALAHGGDYIVSGWKIEQWQNWLSDFELAVPPSGRLLPLIPTRGNHEAGGPMYDEMFGKPGGGLGKNFFTTELSDEVALVTLNTERAAGGVQLEFLQRTLKAHSDKRYRLVQYHRPIFPAVKNPYPGKWTWQPVFRVPRRCICARVRRSRAEADRADPRRRSCGGRRRLPRRGRARRQAAYAHRRSVVPPSAWVYHGGSPRLAGGVSRQVVRGRRAGLGRRGSPLRGTARACAAVAAAPCSQPPITPPSVRVMAMTAGRGGRRPGCRASGSWDRQTSTGAGSRRCGLRGSRPQGAVRRQTASSRRG